MPQKMIQSIYHFHSKEGINMNKIYKVIWSKAKHTYVVASEIAKGHTKGETTGRGLKKLAAALLVAAALMGPNFAWAEEAVTIKVEPASGESAAVEVYTKYGASNAFATIENVSTIGHTVNTLSSELSTLSSQVNTLQSSTAKVDADGKVAKAATADSAESATKAAQDGDGNVIISTYATKTEVSQKADASAVTDEASAREAGDKTLNDRITAVKEYVLKETGDNYVSKADAAVQDGAIVKADKTIGENVTNLDAAMAKETAARLGADAAQDKVIKQVNDNLVASVNTINKNVADGFTALNQADANEAAAREAKDNELNERITNEANEIHKTTNKLQSDLNTETAAREAADTALDTRITNVKEYLEKQTSDKYVSKDDAVVQDGAIVKAANTIGENVTNLDAALAKETAARLGADKAQDKVIQQVNDNLVQSVNTINKNVADGFSALNTADANEAKARADADVAEKAARIGADAKLVEAVNSGISLSADNVLQKNTTNVDADGNVTTEKADVTKMILNKGEMILNKDQDNQITLSDKGIKVGLNSGVMDKDGFYAGADDYAHASAALKSDGSIKGANGKFTVNSANGTVSVNDQIKLNGATGVVKSNGLNVGDGNFTVNNNGGVKAADGKITLNSDGSLKAADGKFTVNSNGGVTAVDGKITLNSDGSVKAADGKFTVNSNGGVTAVDGKITLNSDGSVKAANGNFTVNSNGGVKAADGKITLNSDGSLKAADGKFTVDTNGAVKTANGNTTIDSNGNVKTVGTLSAADGSFKVDSNGKITSIGLDAGNGTIQTTGTVQAGDVKTGTLKTTGDATIGGNLTVDKNLTVNGEFNAKTLSSTVDANNYTTINGGKTQSMNLKMDAETGETKASASTFDENGSNAWAKDDESIGKSSMTADKISQSLSDTGDNPKNAASRVLSQNTHNKYEITDSVVEGNQSNVENRTADTTDSQISFKDDSGKVLNKSYITQNLKKVLMGVEEGDNKTTIEQDANNITNTAKNGTIKNDAKDLVNTATGNMTNTVGGKLLNDVTGDMENKVGRNLTTTVSGTSMETVTGKKTETYNGGLETTVTGEEKHTVNGSQTNSITGDQVNTIGGKQTTTVTGDVTEDYKANLSTTVGGSQTTTVTGDSSLTAENINNTAKNKITNKALDVETDASSSIVNKVSNDAGSNTSTQLSYETKEEMSANGKTASYLRGAAEEKSQLTDGAKKTTIDTIAGQTNTNITDGTNTSNSLQKADQVASSVKNGDNQTVSNQDAESLASSATDGTNTTVANQNAKSFSSAATDGANTSVVSQDAKSINSSVTDGTNSTGIRQDAQNIALSANNGTIVASAKNISNTASKSILNQVGENTSWKMTDGTVLESIKGADGQTNTITDTADSTVRNVKNGSNELTSTTSSTNADLTINNGSSAYTKVNTATGNKETVKEGENLASTNLTKDGFNVYAKDENGHNTIINNASGTTQTIQTDDEHLNVTTKTVGSSEEKLTSGSSVIDVLKSFDDNGNPAATSSVTDGTNTSEVKQTASEVAASAKNISNTATDKITSQIGDGSKVKSEMTADGITNITGDNTVTSDTNGTTFENTNKKDTVTFMDEEKSVDTKKTTISGNTITTGEAVMDYADVMKDLGVRGNATIKGDTTMESNASVGKNLTVKGTTTTDKLVVNNGATVTGGTTTDTLHVTSTSTFDGMAAFKDAVSISKDLSVGGNATVAGDVTAKSFKVGDKTYIDGNGINANDQVIRNVGKGDISEGSTDAVSGGQLYETNTRVSGLETRMGTVETRVDKLDNKIDKVGANAAAMANLHPLEFDEDSKWNVAAAVGSSGSETASAVGVFYRPNENVMVNASAAMGTGENMFGGGVSLRLGHGGNKVKEAQMKAAAAENKELRAKVDDLTARMDALLSVLNPNMSKDFPDVPENHWAYEAVSRLAGNGIVEGYEDGKYHGERQMTRYEMAEIIYNALSKGAKAEKKLVEEFRPELQAMAAQKKA